MGHIFISYSHKDKDYAHKLQRHLTEQGFDAWVDDRINYGSGWTHEIERRLKKCSAFILIMSPNSYDSRNVQDELVFARNLGKEVFPLLLEGEAWWTVASTQYVDVRDGKMPPQKFYVRLAEVSPRSDMPQAPVEVLPSRPQPKPAMRVEAPQPAADIESKKLSIQVWIAIIGAAATLFAALLANWDKFTPAPGVTDTATFTLPAPSKTPIPATRTPEPPTFTPTPGIGGIGGIGGFGGVTMMYVPAGEFTMGSEDGHSDEKPIHSVYLDSFWIDQTEVTNARYAQCVSASGCAPPKQSYSKTRTAYYSNPEFDEYPVIYVNWDMAKTYCEWRGTRLPSEAEWEKAARWQPSPSGGGQGGGEALTYPWGNESPRPDLLNYNGNIGDTSKVGSYAAGVSPYGLYDMAGNVWEWVNDWYDEKYYQSSPSSNPLGPSTGQYRVLRGGSWSIIDDDVRASSRYRLNPTLAGILVGFRCARSLP